MTPYRRVSLGLGIGGELGAVFGALFGSGLGVAIQGSFSFGILGSGVGIALGAIGGSTGPAFGIVALGFTIAAIGFAAAKYANPLSLDVNESGGGIDSEALSSVLGDVTAGLLIGGLLVGGLLVGVRFVALADVFLRSRAEASTRREQRHLRATRLLRRGRRRPRGEARRLRGCGMVEWLVDHLLDGSVGLLPEVYQARFAEEWQDHRGHQRGIKLLWWAACVRVTASRTAGELRHAQLPHPDR